MDMIIIKQDHMTMRAGAADFASWSGARWMLPACLNGAGRTRTTMADEFYCDAPELRSFIGKVKETVAGTATVKAKLAAIRPPFAQLMANPHWLPEDFRRPLAEGGMGKGIANWLLYRDAEGVLTLTALVLPPGVTTPVHDHLAWGLVGLYAGEQEEEVYAPAAPVGPDDRHAELRLTA